MRLIDADALVQKVSSTTLFIKDAEIFQQMITEAPTIEPSGDLISREDAIESMANAIWHYPNELYADLNDYDMAEALAKDGLMSVTSQNLTKPNKALKGSDLISGAKMKGGNE